MNSPSPNSSKPLIRWRYDATLSVWHWRIVGESDTLIAGGWHIWPDERAIQLQLMEMGWVI